MKTLTAQNMNILIKYAKATLEEIKKKDSTAFLIINEMLDKEHALFISKFAEGKPQKVKNIINNISFKTNAKGVISLRAKAMEQIHEIDDHDITLVEEVKSLPRQVIDHRVSDVTIEKHPLLTSYVAHSKLYKLCEIAKIPEQLIGVLLAEDISYTSLNTNKINVLIKKQMITQGQADTLGMISGLYLLFDEDFALTEKMVTSKLFKSEKINTLSEISRLSINSWERLLEETKHFPANKIKLQAGLYQKEIEKQFPNHAFYYRLHQSRPANIAESIQKFNYDILDQVKFKFKPCNTLKQNKNLKKVKKGEQKAYGEILQAVINTYPGLGIDDLLNDQKIPAKQKKSLIEKRIDLFGVFLEKNLDNNLLFLDYMPQTQDKDSDIAKLEFMGLKDNEKKNFITNLKCYQRVFRICNDVQLSILLIRHGIHSAMQIAEMHPGYLSGLGKQFDKSMVRIRDRAKWIASAASSMAGSILDFKTGSFYDLDVANNSSGIQDYLKKIDGYEYLFGELDYCQCQKCQSIFSPAAYFVDLLHFIETRIFDKPRSIPEDHQLHLKSRRPDLWKLPLTCRNTNELIPYLTISNEVLENYIAVEEGFNANFLYDPQDDDLYSQGRTAVENHVYSRLKDLENNIMLPFLLPLEEVKAYFEHFKTYVTRYQIAKTSGESRDVLIRSYFNISQKNMDLINTSRTISFLETLYDYDFQTTGIDPVDVQIFLRALDLDRSEFGDMVTAKFISPNSSSELGIIAEKRDPANDVQNNIEHVYGLSEAHLDRLHRFARLYKIVPWTVKELDLLISNLQAKNLINGISGEWTDSSGSQKPGLLYYLMHLLKLKEEVKINCEEVAVLISQFALSPVSYKDASLFDQLFNLPQYVKIDGTFPKTSQKFIHPAYSTSPVASNDLTLQRLLGGLKITSDDLFTLIENLKTALNLDANNGFSLTIGNLTLLFRHALIKQWLNISIKELFELITICDELTGPHISNFEEFMKLYDFNEWLRNDLQDGVAGSESSIIKYDAIINGNMANLDGRNKPAAILESIIQKVSAVNAFVFADSDLTNIEGIDISVAESQKIIEDNPGIFLPNDDGLYELAEAYSFGSIALPTSLQAHEQQIKDYIAGYHVSQIFPKVLADELSMPAECVVEIIRFADEDYTNANLVRELKGSTATHDLLSLIGDFMPLVLTLRDESLTPEFIKFVYDNPSATFFDYTDSSGSIDYLNIEPARLKKILIYKSFIPSENAEYTISELVQLLGSFTSANKFGTSGATILRKMFGKDIIMTQHMKTILSNNALLALQQLRDLNEYSNILSIPIEQLRHIISNDFDKLRNAGMALLSGFRQKYASEEEYADKIEPFQNKINTMKRDALISYLTNNSNLEFESTSNLYSYFLMDVEMGGCAKTSRIAAAISSLQLFVHRCIGKLEKDQNDSILAQLDETAMAEWAWRKHYRLWEANRKVYVYPENWIEPDVRHDKTPHFKELEEGLLQQDINEQNVLDAYSQYMKEFAEVAHLKIAGAYNEALSGQDGYRLHLIGTSDTTPIQYYYRKAEKIPNIDTIAWHPWTKINVEIPVENASLIVFNNNIYIFWNEINTQPQNSLFTNGTSKFDGYHHKLKLCFTKMRLDGTWAPVQHISIKNASASIFDAGAEGIILDLRDLTTGIPRYDYIEHDKPKDGYRLSGFHWEQILPDIISGGFKGNNLMIAAANWNIWHAIDLYKLTLKELNDSFDTGTLMSAWAGDEFFSYMEHTGPTDYGLILRKSADFVSYHKREYFIDITRKLRADEDWTEGTGAIQVNESASPGLIIKFDKNLVREPQFKIINGMQSGVVITTESGNYLLFNDSTNKYIIERLNTTTTEQMSEMLFTNGFASLLDTDNQESLSEIIPILHNTHPRINVNIKDKIDYTGPMGVYFREIFFHIPFLLANYLNSQQNYEEAQKWYHYIFNPTASIFYNASDTDDIRNQKLRDRVWRYAEFRNQDIETLRSILTDPAAIETYKRNPFNPHAIANLRINAYQKAIVMKYLDNLLDWADYLFNQDTTESINEAFLLYTMAADILGEKPVEIGKCSSSVLNPNNYETIMEQANISSEFLIELEHYAISSGLDVVPAPSNSNPALSKLEVSLLGRKWPFWPFEIETIGADIVKTSPIFCIPGNEELKGYWNRIEQSLSKIRNCMNISGVRRQLSLFAPEINPALLVRAAADGLSLDDVMNAISRNLPPYRFIYMLNLAKNYANLLQQFGGGLLSAIEKKDSEELNKLRVLHESNILSLNKITNDKEIETAQENINSLIERKKIVEYRIDHFKNLINKGENSHEKEQRNAQKSAFNLRSKSQIMNMIASVSYLIPQMGAPTAITFGGSQMGSSFNALSGYYAYLASEKDFQASSAGLEAGFSRREEEWDHQLKSAEKELSQVNKDIAVSQLRLEIAEQNKTVYKQNVAQNKEVLNFYKDKFTTIGLYTYLSKSVQNLYRQFYYIALSTARQAEQAYHFEHNDPNYYIRSNYWESSKSGLLAGEKLSLDLQKLESQFVNTNYRKQEITQSFSLLQTNPDALLNLKLNAECDFEIPEIYFDLFYPGHYRRKIKSVRLTIPCVTGPYTNVSANLTLVSSEIRNSPDAELLTVPKSHTTRIATSTAQNDSGQFDLSFRDDQYAPFEGAGAISRWNLKLPGTFRQFNYKSISDVIVTIQYTAEHDESLRARVEDMTGNEQRAIYAVLTDSNNSMYRLLNFRYDFVNEYHRIMHSSVNTDINIKITNNHFPIYFNDSNLTVASVHALLETSKEQSIQNFEIEINNNSVQESSDELSEKHDLDVTLSFSTGIIGEHVLRIKNLGALANGDGTLIDSDKLINIYLLVEYRMKEL